LGNALRSLGRTKEAIQHVRRAIELRPDYPEALYNLGIALTQDGAYDEAGEALTRALEMNPANAHVHNSMGIVRMNQTRWEDALMSFLQAIRLKADLPSAHFNAGNALVELRRTEEALAAFHEAVRLDPKFADAFNSLGNALREADRLDESIEAFEQALQLRPGFAEAYNNLGIALARQNRYELAIKNYEKALELRPHYAAAHNNLGIAYANQLEFAKALLSYQQAIAIKSDYTEAYNNMAIVQTQQGQYEEAFASYHRAIELKPNYAEAHSNLGIALTEAGRTDEALANYAKALELREHYPDAHMNRALTLLLVGEFAAGWEEYEWRWKCKDFNARNFSQPRWGGEPLDGRRILLHTEQGLGDTFQFVRYARLVRERGGQVIVRCPKPLIPLLKLCPDVAEVCLEGGDTPPFDVHLPLLSLPNVLGTRLDNVPAEVPYLYPDSALVEHWQRQLSYIRGLKVGVNWQGNPRYRGDRHRSIPLAHFAPLAAVEGVRLISLQKGFGTEQLREVRFSVTELGPQVDEAAGAFMDTAAVLKNLDVLVTSDTALAHLAGALGVPVWLALPYAPDWRWMLGRDDSPWYPTMRLFRQSRQGDWEDVFQRIGKALEFEATRRLDGGTVLVPLPLGKLVDLIVALELDLESAPPDGEQLLRLRQRHQELNEILTSALRGRMNPRLQKVKEELQLTKRRHRELESQIRHLDAASPGPPDPVGLLLQLDELQKTQVELQEAIAMS
jgi:Flp pilus assembly protein TadD